MPLLNRSASDGAGGALRIALVGAARRRQGTGPYVARAFARHGGRVTAVVGTTPATVDEARISLGPDCAGYLSLERLLAAEPVDVVAICSPFEHHREQVEAALDAGCHVFCEKPLWWDDGLLEQSPEEVAAAARRLTARAADRGRLLAVNTQWPLTLDVFEALHPGARSAPLRRFEMLLSPISRGARAVVDAAPHLLSMLHALAGPGRLIAPSAETRGPDALRLTFGYAHAGGMAAVGLELRTCPEPPRPARYDVNGCSASRRLDPDTYRMWLEDGPRAVPLPDPLGRSVERFLAAVRAGASGTDGAVVAAMAQLRELVGAAAAPAVAPAPAPIHDFAGKLRQPSVVGRLEEYVRWQARTRAGGAPAGPEAMPAHAPLSINLDLTTACNYQCDHCVDFENLNTGISFDHRKLRDALAGMAGRGLRSVIVIGGGEPTVYPGFVDIIRFMKDLGLQLGIVTNGSRMEKVAETIDRLDGADWIRLSLDAGSDPVFQALHRPRRPITLEAICAHISHLKAANPRPRIGFSFIVMWDGCGVRDVAMHDNIHEIAAATALAKRSRFDYISIKPFLTRAAENHAEVVAVAGSAERARDVAGEIRAQVERARALADEGFEVIESTNLQALDEGRGQPLRRQPRQCHMQFFRQVVSPLGVYNCPVYRNVPHARVGERHVYSTPEGMREAVRSTFTLIQRFDASEECKDVTCLYNSANWAIEDLIEHPERLETLEATAERGDYYL